MHWTPYRGQLVCCIDDTPTNAFGVVELVRGRVYTVREVVEPDELIAFFLGGDPNEPSVMLDEVRRPLEDAEYGEVPFRVSRFQPIDPERIEIFRSMLNPVTRRRGVPA